jgi:predicted NBD/HSP70 family sugar kinase/DNA-binding transcriptional ArsR family regulator
VAAAVPLTGDQRLVRTLNRAALLRLLRAEPGLSRADLAQRSGLTRSTVSLLAKDLLDAGWIAEDEALATGQQGRRPTPLRLSGSGLALMGAEISPDALRVVICSLHGELLESHQAALRTRRPDSVCHQLCQMVASTAQRAHAAGRTLLGIGVALPGAVAPRSGRLLFAPNFGWRDVDVGRRLREELQSLGLAELPVYCQNDADLAAVGEVQFGVQPAASPLVALTCGVGLGAGVVLGDTLFTGVSGAGGELGHTTLQHNGLRCSCGRHGCAEAYIGLGAVAREAGLPDVATLKRIAGTRNSAVRSAFGKAGTHLGVLLQNVWMTFDPASIVLSGEAVTLGGADFIDPALNVLAGYADAAGLQAPPVRVARYAEQAAAVGGAAYALHGLLHPYLDLEQDHP